MRAVVINNQVVAFEKAKVPTSVSESSAQLLTKEGEHLKHLESMGTKAKKLNGELKDYVLTKLNEDLGLSKAKIDNHVVSVHTTKGMVNMDVSKEGVMFISGDFTDKQIKAAEQGRLMYKENKFVIV